MSTSFFGSSGKPRLYMIRRLDLIPKRTERANYGNEERAPGQG